ncbi:DEAD/DEAH box helicase family protein, partial [Mycoplasma marinum]
MNNINAIKSFLLSSNKKDGDKLYKLLSTWELHKKYLLEEEEYYLNAIYNNASITLHPKFIEKKRHEMAKKIREDAKLIKISAPTSFGKTYQIIKYSEELKGGVVFISPTISLCNEYFIKLIKNKDKKV